MADRQDIDALLIDALYGELEGDERERLEAHLVSHPRDRADLEDMKSTRAMLRDAQAAFSGAEPPPAISARLLQEAARRAPAARTAKGGLLGWFATLLQPMLLHPGLSAAAALVVVGGAAGVMYANGRFRTVQPERMASVPSPTMNEARPTGTAAGSGALAAPDLPGTGAGTGYAVAYDDMLAKDLRQDDQAQAAMLQAKLEQQNHAAEAAVTRGAQPVDRKEAADPEPAKKAGKLGGELATPADGAKRKVAAAKGDAYLELDKNANNLPRVRELDDTFVDGEGAEDCGGAGIGGAAASGAAPRAEAPPPPAAAPSTVTLAQKPSAPPVNRDQGRAPAYDAKAEAQLNAWATDQHARMVKLTTAGKCKDAGVIGAELSRRAPEYYQANVANDRAVRACRAYVESARRAKQQEETKSRAAAPRSNDNHTDELDAPAATK